MDTTSYTLSAPPPIVVEWPAVATPECFGDETILMIENVTGGSGNYTFNLNGGALFDLGEPIMIPSGIYVVNVFDDRGCSDDTTYLIMEPNPIVVSILPEDPVVDLGDSIYLEGVIEQSDNAIALMNWASEQPLSCPDCEATWVFNSLPALYTWTVTDINGCQGSSSVIVDVDYDRDVYIPTVFTPNNDGRNEEFRIYTGAGVVSINQIAIYDRWGGLVHYEDNLLPSPTGAGTWNGESKGQKLGPGVYVYVVEVEFIDNNTVLTYRGDVTLIR